MGPIAALATNRPSTGASMMVTGSENILGQISMAAVQPMAPSANRNCSASPNHENQPVMK